MTSKKIGPVHNAALVIIGEDVLGGVCVGSNGPWLGRQLRALSVPISCAIVVPEPERAQEKVIEDLIDACDFVIVTGIFGSTSDEATSQLMARVLGVPLEQNDAVSGDTTPTSVQWGAPGKLVIRPGARIPQGARILWNKTGSAFGYVLQRDHTWICCLPGVPEEMQSLFKEQVLPRLIIEPNSPVESVSMTFRLAALSEGQVAETIAGLVEKEDCVVHVFPGPQGVDLVVEAPRQEILERLRPSIRRVMSWHLYDEDETDVAWVVGEFLRQAGKTLAVAESCTGGLLAHLITEQPGSSDYFLLDAVTYANVSKEVLLSVGAELLATHGAVSMPVVQAMASGVLRLAGADYGLATTGFAGPGGGVPGKPVGTVYVAVAGPAGVDGELRVYSGTRSQVKAQAAHHALTMLYHQLLRDS